MRASPPKLKLKVLHGRMTELQKVQLLWPYLATAIKAFESEAHRRSVWDANREGLMIAADVAHRPVGWWDYESPEPREHGVREPLQLLKMGELRPEEMDAALLEIERWASAPGQDPEIATEIRADVIKFTRR